MKNLVKSFFIAVGWIILSILSSIGLIAIAAILYSLGVWSIILFLFLGFWFIVHKSYYGDKRANSSHW